MTTPQAEPGAGIALGAEIKLSIDSLRAEVQAARRERNDLNQRIYPLDVPAQQVAVSAAGVLFIANSELLGPRSGWHWDVRRVSLAGLNNAETAVIHRGSSPLNQPIPQNRLMTLTGATGVSVQTWTPGVGPAWLRPGQSLYIRGTGLTAGDLITLSIDGVAVAAPYVGAYLL